jgi:hypothetical protein
MITPYTAYTHARDYRVRVRSRYSLDYLEGVFSEVHIHPLKTVQKYRCAPLRFIADSSPHALL